MPFHPPAAARACHDKHSARRAVSGGGNARALILSASLRTMRGTGRARAVSVRAEAAGALGQPRRDPRQRSRRSSWRRSRRIREDGRARIAGGELHSRARVRGGRSSRAGDFQPLAIFDKPDPLEGPFFEETIYVTPSREPAEVQAALIETTAQAARGARAAARAGARGAALQRRGRVDAGGARAADRRACARGPALRRTGCRWKR